MQQVFFVEQKRNTFFRGLLLLDKIFQGEVARHLDSWRAIFWEFRVAVPTNFQSISKS